MSRLLLFLALAWTVGGPALQWAAGLLEVAVATSADTDAGGRFDPNGQPGAEAGNQFDPDGDAGNIFDPDG